MTVDIANRLVQLRKEHRLSQEELAEKLGLSRQAISKWERAEASPDTDNLILLSRLYGVSIDELLRTDAADEEVLEKRPKIAADEREHVRIGWRGVHIEDKDAYVHVGWDGIRVIDKNGEWQASDHLFTAGNDEEDSPAHRRFMAVASMTVVMIYLFMGTLRDFWHPGWLIFFMIPICESGWKAARQHDPNRFAYPVFAAFVYLCMGFYRRLWHPGWVVFLTVPLFYMIFPPRRGPWAAEQTAPEKAPEDTPESGDE